MGEYLVTVLAVSLAMVVVFGVAAIVVWLRMIWPKHQPTDTETSGD